MKAPVRFAVVGCGHIGKRHVAMIQAAPEAQLVAVVDKAWTEGDMAEVVKAGSWAEGACAYRSLSEALHAHQLDVIAVATPNGSHVDDLLVGVKTEAATARSKICGCDSATIHETSIFSKL